MFREGSIRKGGIASVATPAKPCGEEKLVLMQILGGEKLLESANEKFLNGLRGA